MYTNQTNKKRIEPFESRQAFASRWSALFPMIEVAFKPRDGSEFDGGTTTALGIGCVHRFDSFLLVGFVYNGLERDSGTMRLEGAKHLN